MTETDGMPERLAPDLSTERELWTWVDRRTGKRVSMTSTYTREQAERELDGWWKRDARGGRPDLHDLIPHIEVARLDWGGSQT